VPEDPADHRRVLDARQHPDLVALPRPAGVTATCYRLWGGEHPAGGAVPVGPSVARMTGSGDHGPDPAGRTDGASVFGPWRRMTRQIGPLGAGTQFAFSALPGESFWMYRRLQLRQVRYAEVLPPINSPLPPVEPYGAYQIGEV